MAGCAAWVVGSAAWADPPGAAASAPIGPASAPQASVALAPTASATKPAVARSSGGGGFLGGGVALLVPGIGALAGGIALVGPCSASGFDLHCALNEAAGDILIVFGLLHAIAGVTLIGVGVGKLASPSPTAAQTTLKPLVEVSVRPGGASLLYRF